MSEYQRFPGFTHYKVGDRDISNDKNNSKSVIISSTKRGEISFYHSESELL